MTDRSFRGSNPPLAVLRSRGFSLTPRGMQEVDVSSIVPSGRDLLQVIGTRRRSLAVVALIEGDHAESDAVRLAELNVSAFACAAPGADLAAAASGTKTVPTLCLAAATDRDTLLAARRSGADGVCLDAHLALEDWDRLAKVARTMRMLPMAVATDEASVKAAVDSGARAMLVRAATVADALSLAAKAPRTMTVVAQVNAVDATGLRSLAGRVDAAVVPPSIHTHKDLCRPRDRARPLSTWAGAHGDRCVNQVFR